MPIPLQCSADRAAGESGEQQTCDHPHGVKLVNGRRHPVAHEIVTKPEIIFRLVRQHPTHVRVPSAVQDRPATFAMRVR